MILRWKVKKYFTQFLPPNPGFKNIRLWSSKIESIDSKFCDEHINSNYYYPIYNTKIIYFIKIVINIVK